VNKTTASLPKKPSRLGLYAVPVVVLLLGVAVSGWWMLATHMADTAFDRWLASEAVLGRQWTCASRSIGGYPFRIELQCDGFSMTAETGQFRSLALGGFHALAQIYDPKLVIVEANGPLMVRSANGQTASVSWQMMRSSLHFETQIRADRVSTVVDGAVIETSNPLLSGRMGHGEFHMRKGSSDAAGSLDVEVASSASDATFRDNPLPASLNAHLLVKKGWVLADNPSVSGLDSWRSSGGELVIDQWDMKRGEQALSVKGSISLDDGHRLTGKVDLSASGLGDILKDSGLSLLGGSIGVGSVKLPLTLNKGRLLLGPLKLFDLPPLY